MSSMIPFDCMKGHEILLGEVFRCVLITSPKFVFMRRKLDLWLQRFAHFLNYVVFIFSEL